MKIFPIYNKSLLKAIYDLEDCSISELKQSYLPQPQPGIIHGITVSFDNDLQTLISMGCVSVDQDRVRFIKWP